MGRLRNEVAGDRESFPVAGDEQAGGTGGFTDGVAATDKKTVHDEGDARAAIDGEMNGLGEHVVRICGERAGARGGKTDHRLVAAVNGVEIPLGGRGQLGIVVGLGEEVIDNEGFAGRNSDAKVTAAGRVWILVKLFELVVAGETRVGHKAGLRLIGGNLKLGIVQRGVGIAGVARRSVRRGLGVNGGRQKQSGEQGKSGDSWHGSFYPNVDWTQVAITRRRSRPWRFRQLGTNRFGRVRFSRLIHSMFICLQDLRRPALVAFALCASVAVAARAQQTHLWTQAQFEEFEKGTPAGVAIESDGHLRQGPGIKELVTTPSTFVWSVAVDKNGTAYVGTGSPASVMRVEPDGKTFTLFESKEVSVQALRFGPDGALYAGTMPGGKVYKLNPAATEKATDENATVVFDLEKEVDGASSGAVKSDGDKSDGMKPAPQSRYVWDLTFDKSGRMYIATGNPAAVYRVDVSKPGATAEEFFKSDEAHIRCLAWDAKGNLIAGSDGSGLVYRIDENGKGYVLYEAPRREITAIAVGANATIYAASVGDKSHNPLPPLPVQGQGMVSITIVSPQSTQAANESTSVPDGTEIYALSEGQAPRKLWESKDDIVYALEAGADGLLALSGNRGHIYRIQDDGSYADVGHIEAQQGLCLAARGKDLLIGTGNTGKLVELGAAEKHEYASDVLDTGAMARFGRVEIEPGSSGYEILTRTGNIEQPVRGWTDWEPLKDGVVASAPGRFLQWKAVLESHGVVGSVGVNYLPVNAAPVVDELVVVPGARWTPQTTVTSQQTVSISLPSSEQGVTIDTGTSPSTPLQATKDKTAVTVRWAAHDDNGDDLVYSIFLRGDGETVWRLLKDKITEKAYSFDAELIPDGGYQVKVVASDAPDHTAGEALTGDKVSDRFVVDTTPPVVTVKAETEATACAHQPCAKAIHVSIDAEDSTSPIAHAEYSLDAGAWQFIAPVGVISDSKREHYELQIPIAQASAAGAEHLITVRVYDRYENVGVAKAVVPAGKE